MPINTESNEHDRRRALLAAHYAAENARDLDRLMATFARGAEMIFNGQRFADPESIRWAHGYIGFSPDPGAFVAYDNVRDHEHITADEIVVEGRLIGKHVGEFQGYAPTDREVELPFVTFYRFDADGLLASERIVMNLSVLGTPGALESTKHSS
jgi:SnoaL-like protein